VRDEGASLDVAVRANVLLSLLAAPEDALRDMADDARWLVRAGDADDEDWIRATAAVVKRALPAWLVEPLDEEAAGTRRADALDAAVSDAADRLERRAPANRVVLPAELVPLNWPLLSYDALPASFVELLSSQSNPHFSSGLPASPALKQRQAAARARAGGAGAGAGARKPLPPKIQEMIHDAPLLTDEGRAKIDRFFAAPASFSQVEFVLLSETRKEGAPGRPTEVDQVLVKLDPLEKKCTRVTKRKLIGVASGPAAKRLSVVAPQPRPQSQG